MVIARATAVRAKPGIAGSARIALFADDDTVRQIVAAALARSFTSAQVNAERSTSAADVQCAVWVNPADSASEAIERLLTFGGKALVFGSVGPRVAAVLGLAFQGPIELPAEWAACTARQDSHHDASPAAVTYHHAHPLGRVSALRVRPLVRFDFAEEWNNHGFGRISLSHDCWSLATAAEIGEATMLARLATPAHDRLVYAALRETSNGAALWFNRPVGPVDSVEWRVVESFLGDYRSDDLPCYPYVSEVPAGYRAAVCARLDCDEAVASCRPLFELYRDHGLPLSLALLTGQEMGGADLRLLREVIVAGGSVVSHSQSHAPNWGGSYERACAEAQASRDVARRTFAGSGAGALRGFALPSEPSLCRGGAGRQRLRRLYGRNHRQRPRVPVGTRGPGAAGTAADRLAQRSMHAARRLLPALRPID